MLGRAGAQTEIAPTVGTTLMTLKRRAPGKLKSFKKFKGYAPNAALGLAGTDRKLLSPLQDYSKKLYLGLAQNGLIESKTIRFRRKAEGIDRKFVVETSLDPLDGTSVLLRVRSVSTAEIPAANAAGQMLTTQQAAAELNVSRPYVVELVNNGTLKGVGRTAGGHRRIPVAEVRRVRAEMQSGMRKGIDAIAKLTKDARKRELQDARLNAPRRWASRA